MIEFIIAIITSVGTALEGSDGDGSASAFATTTQPKYGPKKK